MMTNLGTSRISRRRLVERLGLSAFGLALAACAAPVASPTAAPPQATVAPKAEAPAPTAPPKATAAPQPTAAPKATEAPAKAQIVKVTLAQSAPGLPFAPIYLARTAKFFEAEAIDLDWQLLSGGALTTTAVVNGDAQFMGTAAGDQFAAFEKELGLISIVGITAAATMGIATRKEFAQQKGVTAKSPFKDKIAALKGSKFGVPTVSGAPTQFAKYLFKTNGINPEADVELITVGLGPSRVAALREGQVQSFIGGSTDAVVAEQEGFAVFLINLASEVPTFSEHMYEVLSAKKEWVEKNSNVAERVCRAIGRANNMINRDLAGSIAALKSAMPELNPRVVELDMDNIKTAFRPDARMNQTMWQNAGDVYLGSGAITKMPPLAEGTLWTNKYLVNIPK